MTKFSIVITLVLFVPGFVLAHTPTLVSFQNYDDTVLVDDPTLSQAFYGEMTGFPHTYQVVVATSAPLFVEVLVPDIETVDNNRSAIVVKETTTGRVEEVARLHYSSGNWESFYEPWGGDSYRRGAKFEGEVTPGSYLIEVSTGDNVGKYVLVIGTREDFTNLGYFKTLARIYEVKRFFGKSPLSVLQSPLYFVPIIVLVPLIYFGYRTYKRTYKTKNA